MNMYSNNKLNLFLSSSLVIVSIGIFSAYLVNVYGVNYDQYLTPDQQSRVIRLDNNNYTKMYCSDNVTIFRYDTFREWTTERF